MSTPYPFGRQSNLTSLQHHLPTARAAKAPIHNPYDKFTQQEFDAWVGGITASLKRALGQHELEESQATTKDDIELSSEDDEHVASQLLEEEDESEDSLDEEAHDSFAELRASRVLGKGKARDPREGPGLGKGDQMQPIEILSDSEDEAHSHSPRAVSDDELEEDDAEHEELEDQDRESGQLSEEGSSEEYEEEEEEEDGPPWFAGESSSQARLREISQTPYHQYNGDDEEDEGSYDEESIEGDSASYEDEAQREEQEYTSNVRQFVPKKIQDDAVILIGPSDEEQDEVDLQYDDEHSDAEYSDQLYGEPRSSPPGPAYAEKERYSNSPEYANDPQSSPPPHNYDEDEGAVGVDNEDMEVEIEVIEGNQGQQETIPEEVQPVKDDTSFPPRRNSSQELPVELPDPWSGAKTYAQDYYSGGDLHLTPGVILTAHKLGFENDLDNDQETPMSFDVRGHASQSKATLEKVPESLHEQVLDKFQEIMSGSHMSTRPTEETTTPVESHKQSSANFESDTNATHDVEGASAPRDKETERIREALTGCEFSESLMEQVLRGMASKPSQAEMAEFQRFMAASDWSEERSEIGSFAVSDSPDQDSAHDLQYLAADSAPTTSDVNLEDPSDEELEAQVDQFLANRKALHALHAPIPPQPAISRLSEWTLPPVGSTLEVAYDRLAATPELPSMMVQLIGEMKENNTSDDLDSDSDSEMMEILKEAHALLGQDNKHTEAPGSGSLATSVKEPAIAPLSSPAPEPVAVETPTEPVDFISDNNVAQSLSVATKDEIANVTPTVPATTVDENKVSDNEVAIIEIVETQSSQPSSPTEESDLLHPGVSIQIIEATPNPSLPLQEFDESSLEDSQPYIEHMHMAEPDVLMDWTPDGFSGPPEEIVVDNEAVISFVVEEPSGDPRGSSIVSETVSSSEIFGVEVTHESHPEIDDYISLHTFDEGNQVFSQEMPERALQEEIREASVLHDLYDDLQPETMDGLQSKEVTELSIPPDHYAHPSKLSEQEDITKHSLTSVIQEEQVSGVSRAGSAPPAEVAASIQNDTPLESTSTCSRIIQPMNQVPEETLPMQAAVSDTGKAYADMILNGMESSPVGSDHDGLSQTQTQSTLAADLSPRNGTVSFTAETMVEPPYEWEKDRHLEIQPSEKLTESDALSDQKEATTLIPPGSLNKPLPENLTSASIDTLDILLASDVKKTTGADIPNAVDSTPKANGLDTNHGRSRSATPIPDPAMPVQPEKSVRSVISNDSISAGPNGGTPEGHGLDGLPSEASTQLVSSVVPPQQGFPVEMQKPSHPVLLSDPFPYNLSTPMDCWNGPKSSIYDSETGSPEHSISSASTDNTPGDRQSQPIIQQDTVHDNLTPDPPGHDIDAEGDADPDYSPAAAHRRQQSPVQPTTISPRLLTMLSPVQSNRGPHELASPHKFSPMNRDSWRRQGDMLHSSPLSSVSERPLLGNSALANKPASQTQTEEELPSILIIKKPKPQTKANSSEQDQLSLKRKRDSNATKKPRAKGSAKGDIFQPNKKLSQPRKGRGKNKDAGPPNDVRSTSSRASSIARSASKAISPSRASSIASSVPSDAIHQSSPSTYTKEVQFRPPAPPPPRTMPPSLMHRHSHALPQGGITFQQRSSQRGGNSGTEPSSSRSQVNSHRDRGSFTSYSSPVTRSNCRYHKISIPRDEDGPRIMFLVPGCTLGDQELIEDEEILDLGDATVEDTRDIIQDLDSLDFDPYLVGVLRLLVGAKMLQEHEVYYMSRKGEDGQLLISRKANLSPGKAHAYNHHADHTTAAADSPTTPTATGFKQADLSKYPELDETGSSSLSEEEEDEYRPPPPKKPRGSLTRRATQPASSSSSRGVKRTNTSMAHEHELDVARQPKRHKSEVGSPPESLP